MKKLPKFRFFSIHLVLKRKLETKNILLFQIQSQVDHFKPLFKTRCHPHIKFFVCSVFAPMCPESMPQAVTSCRSVCEEVNSKQNHLKTYMIKFQVKRDCIKVLEEVDLPWPSPLNCSNFPEESKTQLCMTPEKSGENQ